MVMSTSFTRAALAVAMLSTLSNAHFFIKSPTPIEGSGIKQPLEASGSDFPCHGVALPSSGGQKMAAGSSQVLAFDAGLPNPDQNTGGVNTAVHGGGSCQLSLLYDTSKAADPSAWHVIYSIEGGCPANTKGNLDIPGGAKYCTSQDEGDCVHQFNYTIPEGVQSGNAIMGWTWFNTIGNREMYMNCANVEITGGSGSEMGSLPGMFAANIAQAGGCATKEQQAVGFPDPGKYVIQQTATNGDNYPVSTLACGGAAAAPSSYGGGSSTAAATPTSSAYAAPSSYAAPSGSAYNAPSDSATGTAPTATGAPVYSNPVSSAPPAYQTGGAMTETTHATTFTTVTAGSPGPSASSPAEASPSALASSAGSGSDSGNASGSASGNTSGSVPCSNDGAVVCIDDTHFGICNFGSAVPMPLAAGTTCADGVVSRKMRAVRHAEKHRRGVRHTHAMKL
nr:hypothetical protein B0A51_08584 [Rachicladosporium sp. CCFEE 5018]